MSEKIKVNKDGLTEQEFLKRYDPSKYERPSVTVDMIIFTVKEDKLKLLMIKRGDHPFIDHWALPGGFVNMNENLETAAQRELEEETSLKNIYMRQVAAFGDVGRDPRTRIITVAYMAVVDFDNVQPKAGDDAAKADWYDVQCKVTQKKCENGINEVYYCLELKSDHELLTASLKVSRDKEGRETRAIIESDIASDHAKIIEQALEKLISETDKEDRIYAVLSKNLQCWEHLT